ncbi:unnamed protein product [Alternaria burnsii]|nr:unnamed protein product [Alternaria burnsii]
MRSGNLTAEGRVRHTPSHSTMKPVMCHHLSPRVRKLSNHSNIYPKRRIKSRKQAKQNRATLLHYLARHER